MTEQLMELADRCEKATGPDRQMDLRIEAAINPEYAGMDEEHARFLTRYGGQPPYTASLDAAMQLVPSGWSRWIYDADDDRCICRLERKDESLPELETCSNSTTWPLAIAAASLRARAQSENLGGADE